MEDNSKDAQLQTDLTLNQNKPMNSPGNPFASPTTGKEPDTKELLETVLKLNEFHKAQFSNLSDKYDQLLSMFASDRKTLVEA